MPTPGRFGQARGNWPFVAEMDLIPSRPHVGHLAARTPNMSLIFSRLDNWDEYTRRQYIAKAPQLNPYGTEEKPRTFRGFDIFQKIRILHQLTVWTFWNPDRIRERMPEQKETDQTSWARITQPLS